MTPSALDSMLTPADAEAAAEGVLPGATARFISGGAGAALTLAANRAAFDRVHLLPRILTDVSAVRPAANLLGRPAALPVAIAPMAYQRAIHPDGELAVARAARAAGIPYTACTFGSSTVEDIAATGATVWFQLYWLRDRAHTEDLLARAEAAGATALMLTVDTPYMGRRHADMGSAFRLPKGVSAVHFEDRADGVPSDLRAGTSAVAAQTAAVVDPSLCWADLDWLRANTRLPLVLKGVLDPADADRSAACGIDGIVVSNHGGRQLDGALAALDALPAVAEAVDGRCQILLDSGIRTGTDILKALALGAAGVLLGRPALWGLAAGGEPGVRKVLTVLREELENALALAGCADLAVAARLRTARTPGGPAATLPAAGPVATSR